MSKIGANLAVTPSNIDNLKNEKIGKTADKRKVTRHKATRYLASIIKSLPKLLSSYKISSIAVKTPKLQPPTTQGSRIADNTAMQQQTTLQALNIRKMTAEPATLDALPTDNTPSVPSKDVNTSIETTHHSQNSITVNTTRDTAELYHSESPTTIGSADLESHTIPMDKIINITLNEPSETISLGTKVVDAAQNMVGKYQWGFPAMNAHGKENGLQELVRNDTPITKDSKLNCWEGVLQAGMESGVLPKDKLVSWLIDNEAMDIDFIYT